VAGQPKQPSNLQDKQPTVPVRRPIREIAVHTANRTEIYRYEEVRPGEWRLKEKLVPAQTTVGSKEETQEGSKENSSPDNQPNSENKPTNSKVE
jgi:hypothetical protein